MNLNIYCEFIIQYIIAKTSKTFIAYYNCDVKGKRIDFVFANFFNSYTVSYSWDDIKEEPLKVIDEILTKLSR